MEEYKFNSQSSYSSTGERTGAEPITLSFRSEKAESVTPPKKKKSGGKALKVLAAGILVVGVSFGSGALGAALFGGSAADMQTPTLSTNTDAAAQSSPADRFILPESTSAQTVVTTPTETSYAEVAAKTKPTVVEITTEMASGSAYFQQFIQSGAGSGVIISDDGYIITNNHVIEGATKITVRLTSGNEHVAELIGADAQADIAVIKINATNKLAYAVIGSSANLAVGEEVLAIGNPLGELGGSVTNGIISALDRELTIDGQTMRLLQTNAAINPGNSGGGLFDMQGKLIAIVNAKSSGTGIE